MGNFRNFIILLTLIVNGFKTAYAQQTASSVTLTANEYDFYLRWVILGQACVKDAADYQGEIIALEKANKAQSIIIKNDSTDLALDSIANLASFNKIKEYRGELETANNKYAKAKKWRKVFTNTTIIFVSTSLLEGLFIWAIVNK